MWKAKPAQEPVQRGFLSWKRRLAYLKLHRLTDCSDVFSNNTVWRSQQSMKMATEGSPSTSDTGYSDLILQDIERGSTENRELRNDLRKVSVDFS